MPKKISALLAVISGMGLFAGHLRAAQSAPNLFMEGYIAGVLQVRLHVSGERVTVEGGTVVVYLPLRDAEQKAAVTRTLTKLPHVRHIKVVMESSGAASQSPSHTSAGSKPVFGPSAGPAPSVVPPRADSNMAGHGQNLPQEVSLKSGSAGPNLYRLPTGPFPAGRLFGPLLADPRWPGFSAEYQHFSPDHPISGLRDVIQVSIGDTISFDRKNLPDHWQWEYGMQATVFAFFNTDTAHSDLQNADYFVGGYAAFRHKNLSFIIRYYHQSSHLGDELLIDNPQYLQLRQKISYEELNAIVSLDFYHRMFRVYAGGGYLNDVEPTNLGHWRVHYGAEFHGPTILRLGFLRVSPVAGADFKNWDETNWDTNVSLRAGFELERNRLTSPKIQFLLEFYNGHDPNGQFYVDKVQYLGFGVHYYF